MTNTTIAIDQSVTFLENDWRLSLFGDLIMVNSSRTVSQIEDVEIATEDGHDYIPTEEAFDQRRYQYIAIFVGAEYCNHCKDFAPLLLKSVPTLERIKKCKVVFLSNDRTGAQFQTSCQKVAGIDVVPYDLNRTKAIRNLFKLKTIPALIILRNDNFEAKRPTALVNARQALLQDPQARNFPWTGKVRMGTPSSTTHHNNKVYEGLSPIHEPNRMSWKDRLIISGKHGKWWDYGHRYIHPDHPHQQYMDEHAVRIRGGILNSISWLGLINLFVWKQYQLAIYVIFPIVAWEMVASMTFGLVPFAPIGTPSAIWACILHPEPHWKPAQPKRFAWAIALTLVTTCFFLVLSRDILGDELYLPLNGSVIVMCNLATWLEAAAGFCIGCFMYNTMIVPCFNLEECAECKY